jgi:HD superfamily phosphodiesterase
MLQQVYQVTAGGLLHDIGKVIYRAQSLDSRSHPQSDMRQQKKSLISRKFCNAFGTIIKKILLLHN